MTSDLMNKMFICLLVFGAFFYNFISFPIFMALVIISIIVSYGSILKAGKISFKKDVLIMNSISFLFIFLIFLGYTINGITSISLYLGVAIVFILIFLNQCMLVKIRWQFILKIMYLFSIVHVSITIFAALFTNVYFLILGSVLSGLVETAMTFYQRGYYTGITTQTGQNALYIVVCFGISIIFFFYQKEKKYLLLAILSFVAILLTGKRAHLMFSIIGLLPILYFYSKKYFVSFIKYFSIIVFLLIIGYITFLREFKILDRFKVSSDTDFSSGRLDLFSEALKMIEISPLFGQGIGSFVEVAGIHVHNIYLQTFAENGLFVCVTLILFFVYNILNIIIKRKKTRDKNNMLILDISLFFQLFFVLYGLTGNPLYDLYIFMILGTLSILHYSYELRLDYEENRYFKLSPSN